jgi:hypothetical protein
MLEPSIHRLYPNSLKSLTIPIPQKSETIKMMGS